ncbi:cation:proton antiporter [Rhodococcus spelaei]|uniref:Cation:proton antiporter n=1 Tax=Rhodococcus spelaei TaxID=2546320 RepID=A0A541AZJ9_9NOCA|nr:cation:proton antiporter [Rhodococcus spelaei]TQF65495.1 cation:proton antiporter [Rhodococcus spelaei]
MGFSTLAFNSAIALLGPALAYRQRWHFPVVLGELVAGVAVGATGLGLLDATDPTLTFLADIGFALVMFVAGTHVPMRQKALRPALARGAVQAIVVGVLAVPAGLGVATVFDTGHAPLYSVLIASSSAALVLPIVDSLRLGGTSVLQLVAQVAVADTACIVALPLVIDPAHAPRAALGALAVAGCAVAVYWFFRALEYHDLRGRLHRVSEDRKFAMELRVNLCILFGLAALAVWSHVSIMLAGFALGLAVAAVGEPHRLARQLFGITEGFFGPLFYVWLGASLNLRELVDRPSYSVLGVVLGLAAVAVHCLARFLGQPLPLGALAAAQLGIPVAAATIGTQLHLLSRGEAPALLLGALVTIGIASVAGGLATRRGLTKS